MLSAIITKVSRCIDCDKKIDKRAERCRSCSSKYKWNHVWELRKGLSVYYCIEEKCNKVVSEKNRRCGSCGQKERNQIPENCANFKDGRTLKEYQCKICEKKVSLESVLNGSGMCRSCSRIEVMKNPKTIEKISNSRKGKVVGRDNHNYGKTLKPHWGKYKDVSMRSSWEVAYGKDLDKLGIKWLYEPKTFDLGNTTYTPDFYLPKIKKFVEIKGYFSNSNKKKMKKFKKQYANIKLKILFQKDLEKLGVLYA
ncbi:hypothetical protein LCGC14_1687520 [marine sediment metagenome]|uniref:Nuclease associated modular domain-containing protein n=1 Tax=marine sediment metagenome TaxID=412755 RepID=A0A0F9HLW3_9ZZZZ